MFVKLHGWSRALPNQDIFEVANLLRKQGEEQRSGFSVHGTHVIDTAKTTKLEKWVEHTRKRGRRLRNYRWLVSQPVFTVRLK